MIRGDGCVCVMIRDGEGYGDTEKRWEVRGEGGVKRGVLYYLLLLLLWFNWFIVLPGRLAAENMSVSM